MNRHEIIALLRQFDRCTSFVISQAGDTWNATYQLKSKHLRSRLLSAIKFHLSATMRETMLQNEAVQQMPCSTHDLNIVKDECFIDDEQVVKYSLRGFSICNHLSAANDGLD